MTPLQELTNKIYNIFPEITELKFGCKVKNIGSKDGEAYYIGDFPDKEDYGNDRRSSQRVSKGHHRR